MSGDEPNSVDRGPFGRMLGELRARGIARVAFFCDLEVASDDPSRWLVECWDLQAAEARVAGGRGRTGEEALRSLVERLT